MTTAKDIAEWFKNGKREKKAYLIVVCDTFSYEDYPVYVGKKESLSDAKAKYNGQNMQKIMEVYDLSKKIDSQISQFRAGM